MRMPRILDLPPAESHLGDFSRSSSSTSTHRPPGCRRDTRSPPRNFDLLSAFESPHQSSQICRAVPGTLSECFCLFSPTVFSITTVSHPKDAKLKRLTPLGTSRMAASSCHQLKSISRPPILDTQTFDTFEFFGIRGYENEILGHCGTSNEYIIWTNGGPIFLENCSNSSTFPSRIRIKR